MPGIEWISTLDNSGFVRGMQEMQRTMNRTAAAIYSLKGNFDISNVVNQVVALTKSFQENEAEIKASQERIMRWRQEAEAARDAGDFTKFQNKQLAIDDALSNIQVLEAQNERYKQSLNDILGLWNNLNGQKPPMLFSSQEEYDRVQELKVKIAELQAQIGNFSGSDDDLQALKARLTELNGELYQSEARAADSAAKMGNAGSMAAAASTHYYELTNAIKEQERTYAELLVKLRQAKEELEKAQQSGDSKAIEEARAKVDAFSSAVHNASMSLNAMRGEQREFQDKMRDMAETATKAGSQISETFKTIAGLAGISFTLNGVKDFVKEVVNMRSYFQDIESSMKVFLGSQEAGAEFTKKLQDAAYYNMFEFKDLAQASQQMIAYGHDVDTIIPRIQQLSDIAVGTHGSIMELVNAYNKAKSTGVVDARGIQSWAIKGVMIKDVLKEMGEEAVSSSITFEQLNKVIDKVTGDGGMFHNLQQEMMSNISAEIGQFQDNFALMLNEIGEKYQDTITGVIKFGSELVDNYKEIGSYIMDAVVAFGLYKAALVAANVAEKVHVYWKGLAEIATMQNTLATSAEVAAKGRATVVTVALDKAQAALNKTMLANPYVLAATVIAGLAFGIYKLATAEDAETAARRRANEQMDEFKKKIDEQKERVQGYINVLHDPAATDYEKAVAWENLTKEAARLTEGYTQAEFAALEMDEAQKKLNETMEEVSFEEQREELEKWRDIFNQLNTKNAFQELSEEYQQMLRSQGITSNMSGMVNMDAVQAYLETLQHAFDEVNDKREKIRKEAEEKAIPITIRVQEANENIQEKQAILGFYDKAMLLAKDVQDANNDINYQEARRSFDGYIDEVASEVEELRKEIEKHPGEQKLVLKYEERMKVLDALTEMRKTMHDRGLDTITFNLQFGGLSSLVNQAKGALTKVLGSITNGMHLNSGNVVVADNDAGKTFAQSYAEMEKASKDANKALKTIEDNAKKNLETWVTGTGSAIKIVKEGTEGARKANKDDFDEIKRAADNASKAYKEVGGDPTGKKGAKAAKESSNRNAKQLQERWKHEEQMADLEEKAARAREDASIAAIQSQAERERKERETQYQRTIEDLKSQEEDIYKTIYNQRKQAYETANKDKKYENTQEGSKGWKGLMDANQGVDSIQAQEKSIIEALAKGNDELQAAMDALTDKAVFNGNVDLIARPLIDAAELVEKGWQEAGKGIATVYSSQNAFADSTGGEREILYTPILPDGSVLSPQELEAYIADVVGRSMSVEEILAKDTKGLVIAVDVPPVELTGGTDLGERLHQLQEQMTDALSEEDTKQIQDAYAKIRSGARLTSEEQRQYQLAMEKINADIAKAEAENSRRILERYREEAQAMRDYLKEYGSYEQQRLAVAEEYAEKIRNARTEGEKLQLQKQQEQAQANLSLTQMTGGIDWKAVFGGVENMTTQMMKTLTDQLRAWQQSPDYQNADAGTKQQVAQMLADMRQYLGSDMSVTWKTLASDIEKFNASVDTFKEAQEAEKPFVEAYEEARAKEDEAIAKLEELTQRMADGDANVTQADVDAQQKTVNTLAAKTQAAADAMKPYSEATAEAKEDMEAFGQQVNTSSDELKNFVSKASAGLANAETWKGVEGFSGLQGSVGSFDNLKGALDAAIGSGQISGKFAEGMSSALDSVLGENGIGGMLGGIGEGVMGMVGIVAQIPKLILNFADAIKNMVTGILDAWSELLRFEWLSDLIVSITDAIGNLVDAVFDLPESIAKLISTVVVDGIGGLLDSVIGRITSVFGIHGDPSDWFKNSNAKEVQEAIDRLNERNELLTTSIDKLTETMSKSGGNKAIEQYAKLAELQKELEDNLKEQMELQMGYHSNHHSFNSYWSGFSADQLAAFNRLNGTEWNGDLSTLNADLAAALMADADMWQAIKDTGKGGYGERVADKIAALAEQAGVAKEQIDALNASLTAGTTADSVYDDFLSSLYDLADGSEDVMDGIAEKWQQMVNRMVVNNLIGEDFRKDLEGWYEELANLNKRRQGYDADGNILNADADGNPIPGMTDEEYKRELDRLSAIYNQHVDDAAQKVKDYTEAGIIKPIEDATDEALMTLDDIRSGWLNILMDMSADTEDWTQDIAKMMTEALIQSEIFNDAWNEQQEDWVARYEEAMKDQTLTDAQRKAILKGLQDEQQEWVEDARRKAKEIMEMTGYGDSTSSQSATATAMERITVDQADELIGRMNAGQMIWEQHKGLTAQIYSTLTTMQQAVGGSLGGDVNNLVSLAAVRNKHLADILAECGAFRRDMALAMDDLRRDFNNKL